MKQEFYKSDSGDLNALLGSIKRADLLIMITTGDRLETHTAQLKARFPQVPSIASTGHFYGRMLKEGGVGVVAMTGVKAVAGVMRSVSTMPMRDIKTLEDNLQRVGASAADTVCVDFCTGNDSMALSSMHSALRKNNISLMGGTAFDGKVSVNGTVYEDALAYALIKNVGGKVKVYKENLYSPMNNKRYIASDTDRSKYYIGKLNGLPARDVYLREFHINESQIQEQTFRNPFGKFNGKEIYIISLKEAMGSGLCCYRQVSDSDVLSLLQIGDHISIANQTLSRIRRDFDTVSGVFSVNCAFRYLYFKDNGFLDDYLNTMSSLGSFCGFVGNGEHINNEFINQSMTCVVFS